MCVSSECAGMHVCMIGMLFRFVYEGSVEISVCLYSSASRFACSRKYLQASILVARPKQNIRQSIHTITILQIYITILISLQL